VMWCDDEFKLLHIRGSHSNYFKRSLTLNTHTPHVNISPYLLL